MLLFHFCSFSQDSYHSSCSIVLCFHFFFKLMSKLRLNGIFLRLKIGDFHSIMCFICYQWAPFSVCSFSKKLLCKKYHNKKKDVCHKTKQMIAMKKKGSRLIVYGVFFLFLPFFLYLMLNVFCILLGKCFFFPFCYASLVMEN